MKVAIVTPTLSHFEVPLFRIAASMPELEVRVFHNDAKEDAFYDKDYGTVIHWGESLRGGYPNTYFDDAAKLKAALFKAKPDVIMMCGYAWRGSFSILAEARGRRIPILHRGLLTHYHNPREQWLKTKLWRLVRPFMLRRFDGHHYGGTYSKRVLDEAGIPADRQFFIPFSVDSPYFLKRADDPEEVARAASLKAGLGWSDSYPVLLYMCQHTAFKAPDVMLQTFAGVLRAQPDAKLLMAGSGSMTEGLKAWAATNLPAGSFHFPGFVSSKQTMPYYLAADIVAFPSHYDTWSRGVNEAMLARRPCVVSRVVPASGGLVAHGENGYVVDGLDPKDHAAAVLNYLGKSAGERSAMAEAARIRALEFSYEAHRDDLLRSLTVIVRAAR